MHTPSFYQNYEAVLMHASVLATNETLKSTKLIYTIKGILKSMNDHNPWSWLTTLTNSFPPAQY